MGFFSKLKSSLEPSPRPKPGPVNPAQSEFAKALNAAIEVVGDFGEALEVPHPEDGQGIYVDEKHLPHSRQTITIAYDLIQKVLANQEYRAAATRVLTPEGAQYFLSERYASALRGGRAALDCYVPTEKLAEQRAATALLKSACESLPSGFFADLPPQTLAYLDDVKKLK